MNHANRSIRYARVGLAAVFAASVLAGCWGGDDDDSTTAAATVPASAGESSASFVSYLRDLATNDTDEPLSLEGFTAPTDDTSEPLPLT